MDRQHHMGRESEALEQRAEHLLGRVDVQVDDRFAGAPADRFFQRGNPLVGYVSVHVFQSQLP